MPALISDGNGVSAFRGVQVGAQRKAVGTPAGAASTEAQINEIIKSQINFGNAVAPTAYLLGVMQLTDDRQFYTPEDEDRYSLASVHRATAVSKSGGINFSGSLQFEALPWLMSAVMGHATNGADILALADGFDGAGAPARTRLRSDVLRVGPEGSGIFRWHFRPSMQYRTEPEFYTFYYGDSGKIYRVHDALATSLELRYSMNSVVMQTLNMFSRGLVEQNSGFVTGITQPVVHDAVSQLTDIYLGDNGSALGGYMGKFSGTATATDAIASDNVGLGLKLDGTPLTELEGFLKKGLIASMNLSIPSGFNMTRYSSGDLDFTDYSQSRRAANIDLQLRHSIEGRKELAKFRADSDRGRLLRMVTKGPSFATLAAGVDPTNYDDGGPTGETKFTDGVFNYSAVGTGSHGTVAAGNQAHHVLVVDMSILYNEPPTLLTDYNGDSTFNLRGRTFGDETASPDWKRDMAVIVQTNKAFLQTPVT